MKALTSNAPTIAETATITTITIGLILLLGCKIFVEKARLPDSESKFYNYIEVQKTENKRLCTKNRLVTIITAWLL